MRLIELTASVWIIHGREVADSRTALTLCLRGLLFLLRGLFREHSGDPRRLFWLIDCHRDLLWRLLVLHDGYPRWTICVFNADLRIFSRWAYVGRSDAFVRRRLAK